MRNTLVAVIVAVILILVFATLDPQVRAQIDKVLHRAAAGGGL